MTEDTIRVGVIGCGSFGLFALQQFTQVEGLELVGMAGTHRPAAKRAAERYGIPDIVEVDRLVEQPDIDLVYIATPPFLHHPQAMQALEAGKHVVCEKPLALSLQQADEMIGTARSRDLLLVANLMQRYGPYYETVQRLIEEESLGEPLHAYFENYAADEFLSPDHWFWDRRKSGGIFVEHGVHFFDMFAGWFGQGEVVAAQAVCRPGTDLEEQVQCTVRYPGDILVNFYHGFHQPARMDRQEMRFVFERGDVTLFEWVPTRSSVHAVADEADTRRLCDAFPRPRLDTTHLYAAGDRRCRGRHKDIDAWQMLELHSNEGRQKWHTYGDLLRALMRDQTAWIRDRDHERLITAQNGRQSLRMALEADRLAHC